MRSIAFGGNEVSHPMNIPIAHQSLEILGDAL